MSGMVVQLNPLKLAGIPYVGRGSCCLLFPLTTTSTTNLSFIDPPSTSSSISTSLSINPHHFVTAQQHDALEEDDDELIIGDCLVFEDGVFDDPFLHQQQEQQQQERQQQRQRNPHPVSNTKSTLQSIQPDNLVPEDWNEVVEEINLTKDQRRRIAQQTQFGHRILHKKAANCVNLDEYLRFQNYKLSQLNPVVLDNPTPTASPSPSPPSTKQDHNPPPPPTRVQPLNPRSLVYGRGLDDITQFFNSATYQPNGDNADKSQGRQKLFTKEEKLLMNARMPKLSNATSLKWLPLHTLTASGEFYLVNALLKYQVDINAADQDGLTALHKAIISKKQAITNYLLRESANSFVRDKDGATLMHYAVQTASSEAIKTLVLHNVDINLQDNDGWTPLHIAVQSQRTDVVRLLLVKGANKTLKNKIVLLRKTMWNDEGDGLTPLELCLHCGRGSKTYELIKLLKQLPGRRGRG